MLGPKQGTKIEGVVLNRVRILGIFCPKQGQGFKSSAAHRTYTQILVKLLTSESPANQKGQVELTGIFLSYNMTRLTTSDDSNCCFIVTHLSFFAAILVSMPQGRRLAMSKIPCRRNGQTIQ